MIINWFILKRSQKFHSSIGDRLPIVIESTNQSINIFIWIPMELAFGKWILGTTILYIHSCAVHYTQGDIYIQFVILLWYWHCCYCVYHLQHFTGLDEAVYRNIDACRQLTRITRSSFGPNGELLFEAFLSIHVLMHGCAWTWICTVGSICIVIPALSRLSLRKGSGLAA